MRCAAFNTGGEFYLLDHIAPLAELMQMPLIVTEEKNFELASQFYPQIEVRLMPDLEFRLGEIAEEFDALFESKFWGIHLKSVFEKLYNKRMRLIYCPHGQSDKTSLLGQYALQDLALHYGPLMVEMLKELNIPPPNSILVGNYRLQFYQKHKTFYDSLFQIDRKKTTLLYAPTWKDRDRGTSFFDYGARVISELPSDWNLILKVHPMLEERDPGLFYPIARLAEKKGNVFLIHEFPPIYPLLAQTDVYLGDFSSIGYDFLAFRKPLYFLPTTTPGRLHSCGARIDPEKDLYSQLALSNRFQKEQEALYQLSFSPVAEVHATIRRGLSQTMDKPLN